MIGPGTGASALAPSGTVTFLFSEIEDGTQRWARDPAAMREALRLHDRLMREAIERNGGHVFKTVGDCFCAAFPTPEAAARAAFEGQRALGEVDFSAVDGLPVRMALNTGTADERDGDYFGPALNRVARLLAVAHGGQVLMTRTTADLVRENPPAQLKLAALGPHALKDLDGHEQVHQLVAPGLQRDFPELRTTKVAAPWLVPDALRTRYFTGRDDLLGRLHRQLAERARAVLSGLGGVGKTQTAIEYAWRYRDTYPSGVFWVGAETAGGLTGGFVEIARTLSLATAERDDQERAVRDALEWLDANERWLLVLDNVDDRNEVRPFVPERGKGHVLITSREPVFAELGIPRAIDVGDLDDAAAVDFLLVRTGREGDERGERAAAAELAAQLGNLPLALEQAAAYIVETNASFSDYTKAYRKRRVALLEKAGVLVSHATVAVTWAANFDALRNAAPAAADVLRLSTFLAPDAIPFEFLLKGARAAGGAVGEAFADGDDITVSEELRPLSRYSLVRSDASLRTYGLHRLVQEVVRASLDESETRAYIARSVGALDAAMPPAEALATWPDCERLVTHVMAVAGRLEAYELYPAGWLRLATEMSLYLRERGRYAEAAELSRRALSCAERVLNPTHPHVATLLDGLALAYLLAGHPAEALPLQERALDIRTSAFGPDHLVVASSLNNLAMVFTDQERYAEAQSLQERALAIWERACEPNSELVAIGLNNLALSYYDQGRYVEAQPIYERAVVAYERALGPDHPHLAFSVDGLARVLTQLGRCEDAGSLFERALSLRERAGAGHPHLGYVLVSFAKCRSKQGRTAEAGTFLERAVAILENAHGNDHPMLTVAVVDLASLRKMEGRNAEALELYERALAANVRAGARESPELAEIRDNIAALRSTAARDGEGTSQGR